jgi:integrase
MAKKGTRTRGNGMGTVYKLPSGKWCAEVTLGWRKTEGGEYKRIMRRKKGFKTKKEALEYLPTLKESTSCFDENILFCELYDRWSDEHYSKISRNHQYAYEASYRRCAKLHHRQFRSLRAADLQMVIDDIDMSRRVKEVTKSLLNNLYAYALKNDICDKNYAQYIVLPPKEKSKKDAFTKEERDKLWDAYYSGHDFAGQILLLIYTGMRYGEASILRKSDVHLSERYIVGGIKTDAGKNRIIPIADCIYPIVEKLYNSAEDKLLTRTERKWYYDYYATLEQLGIRRLNPHCCRHTCATALAEAGVQPAIIKAIIGHTDYSTTLQYTHISVDELLAGVNAQYKPGV